MNELFRMISFECNAKGKFYGCCRRCFSATPRYEIFRAERKRRDGATSCGRQRHEERQIGELNRATRERSSNETGKARRREERQQAPAWDNNFLFVPLFLQWFDCWRTLLYSRYTFPSLISSLSPFLFFFGSTRSMLLGSVSGAAADDGARADRAQTASTAEHQKKPTKKKKRDGDAINGSTERRRKCHFYVSRSSAAEKNVERWFAFKEKWATAKRANGATERGEQSRCRETIGRHEMTGDDNEIKTTVT